MYFCCLVGMVKLLNVKCVIYCLFLLSNFFLLPVFASSNDIKLSTLGVEDGLSQGSVMSVIQDEAGFIWVGTDNGLNIYDGYSFKLLPGPDGDFKKLTVQVFKQDAQGLIWVNVYDRGVYTYNPKNNQYTLILSQTSLEKNHYITSLEEAEDQIFWISTSKKIYKFDAKNNALIVELDLTAELTGNNSINKVVPYQDYLILGTNLGFFLYHKIEQNWRQLPPISTSYITKNAEKESEIYTLYIHEHDLYIGTQANVLRLSLVDIDGFFYERSNFPVYHKLAEGISTLQFTPSKGKLYVGSDQGLLEIDLEAKRLDYLFGFSDIFDDVSDNSVKAVMQDNKGMFWLGTSTTGLYLWKPSNEMICNYRYDKNNPNSLSFNNVLNILPDRQQPSYFWAATGNGLNLVNDITQSVETFLNTDDMSSLYSISHIFHMEYYNETTLLLGTYEGVKFFDTQEKKLILVEHSPQIAQLLSGKYITFYVDDTQNIYLANNDGIYKISLITQTVDLLFNLSSDINYKNINQEITNLLGFLPDTSILMFSNNDSLWGVNVNTKESKLLYNHPRVNVAESTYIDNWVIDKKNTLWLTFVGKGIVGLSLLDFKPKYHYSSANSIINNNVYNVQLDDEGDLWFSTHNGIYSMDIESHHFRNFTNKHGFSGKEFNASAGALLASKRMVYGGMSGVNVFDPLELKRLQVKENFDVTITNVSVLSRELNLPLILDPKNPIEISYDDVGISIDFSTLIYKNTERIRYEYSLSGSQDVLYPLTYDNKITFPTLSSGKHVLEIRAESPVTGKYSKPTIVTFIVSYAPWASPIAYIFYFLIAASIISLWFRKREQQRAILLNAHEEVKYRENRLQLALTGSNSEVWDWQANNNLMFGKRASQDLGYKNFEDSYLFIEHVSLIHPDDKEDFLSRWEFFIANDASKESFTCTYRLKDINEKWLWYKDLGKIVEFSDKGKPSRITGSYTNITDTKASEERALYYGDAFKETKDWVFIISENFTKITANKSLCDVFGWQHEEFTFSDELFGFSKEKKEQYRAILSSLKEGEHWKSEEVVSTRRGEEYNVIVNIAVSRNKANNKIHYICVFSDISAQKVAEKELRYLANYDHLTNLPNRSLLLERIKSAIEYSNKNNTSIALFFIDLDRFKQINDTLGHSSGDLLLQEVTTRLSDALRIDDTIARIGGDEFVVLLEYFKGNAEIGDIAQKLINVVGQPFTLKGNMVSVGASIGIAQYPNDAKDSDELLRNADVAMYCSKQLGRNTFQFFTQRMQYEANLRLNVESNFKQGIINNELVNHYQPIVDSIAGQPIGFELLLRWKTSEATIPPLTFIPIAEELGLIVDITEAAIDRGLSNLVSWREENENLFLSVNISPLHFTKESLVPFIKAQLLKHNLPASALKLEVTESILLAEPEKAIKIMNVLSSLGLLLSLDDFGTGYSSLSYLKRLPLQIIKIDRSFISGINVNHADEAIVDATIVLAKRLNMTCIAEGVETEEQLNYLMKRDCKHIQGYFYSRPLSAGDLSIYLEKHKVLTKKMN